MKEENAIKKYHDWLIPVLSLLIIFQSGILITRSQEVRVVEKQEPYLPVPTVEEVQEADSELVFVPAGISLRAGETTTVDLIFTPKRNVKLDGMDIVLTFDPAKLQISQVTTPKLFSFVTQNKTDEKKGRIYLTFLEEKDGGLLLDRGTKILALTLKGKIVGESGVALVTADEGPTTVIAESGTSKKISFAKGSLKVVVY